MADEQKDRRIEGTSGSAASVVDKLLVLGRHVQLDYWAASALDLAVLAGCMLVLADCLAVLADYMAVAGAGCKEVVAGLQTPCVAQK